MIERQKTSIAAFTLIELLIVVSIVALLVLVAMVIFNPKTQIQKARDAKRKNDLQLMKTKLEDYYNDNESYPSPPCGEECCEIDCDSNFLSPYLVKFPCDPQRKKYIYCADANKSQWYKIYTNLEYTKDKAIEDSGCKDNCLVTGGFCCNYGISSSNTSIATSEFCQTRGFLTSIPTTQPTIEGIYTACQVGRCNVVADPVTQCGPGKQFPVCFFNDLTCGNCSGPNCLPAPECYQ